MAQSSRISWLILLGVVVILFHRLLLGDALFWGLPSLQFIPWRLEALDLLRSGQLPLWNSFNGAGAPLFANYQTALLYPFSWLTIILPAAPAMSLTAVAHLVIAGIGMWHFTKKLGISSLGQGVSLLAYALSGYLVARVGTFPIVQAAAWLPWLLWASASLVERVTPSRTAWMALFSALILLAGHAQTAWYALLMTGAFSLVYLLATTPRRFLALIAIVGGIVLGAGVAAVQLAGTAELLGQSQRSGGVDYDFAMNLSYAPLRSLNLLTPNIFGTPADGTYITGGAFFEDAVYAGLIPLIAAITAIAGWFMRRDDARLGGYKLIPFWFLITLVGFVFALGVNTPIFPFFFDNVPTFDAFQGPVRWHLWTITGLSILAGIGVSMWARGLRSRRWTMRALVACGGAVMLALIVLMFTEINVRAIELLAKGVLYAGIAGIAACILTLNQPAKDDPAYGRWSFIVLLVIAADLGFAGWGLNPTVASSFYAPREVETNGRLFWQEAALEQVRFEEFLRFDNYHTAVVRQDEYRASLLPNMNLLDNAPVFNNFDPLLPGQHLDYLELLDASSTEGLMHGAGIGAVWTLDGENRLTSASPRAWVVESVCWHTTDAGIRDALTDADWLPYEQLHMLGDAGCPNPKSAVGTAQITSDTGNEVVISVNGATQNSWLVLADTDYPGWLAQVDGESVPIYRANLSFRAVQLDDGVSEVRFAYYPSWLLPGALVSVVSLVAMLLLFRLRAPER